jgi:hypothetical protein
MTHLRYIFKAKNPSVLGAISNLFWRLILGFGVNGFKVYIIHWFQCQAKVHSRPFMEFRNIQMKVSPLLRVTVEGMLIPILLLFNVYLMIYLNLYPTRAILELQRFTIAIYIYIYIYIYRENYSGNSLKEVNIFWQIFATLKCLWEKTWTRCFEV